MPIQANSKKQPLIHAHSGIVAIAAEKGDDKGPAKFSIDAYTGGALEVEGYDLPIAIDLSGLTYARHIVANLDHNRSMRVGHVTAHSVDGSTLKLTGIASAATPYREEVVQSAKDGFEWEASIEAYPTVITEVGEDDEIEVNGQTLQGPLYVATKAKLTGFAFVSHGADPNTTTTIAASGGQAKGEKKMDPKFRQFVIQAGCDPDNLTPTLEGILKASFDGTPTRPAPVHAETIKDRLIADRKRRDDINGYAQKLADPAVRTAQQIEAIFALAEDAIEQGKTFQEFRLDLTDVDLGRLPQPVDRGTQNITDKVLECAVVMTGGHPLTEKMYDERTLDAARREFRNGISLNQLFLAAARMNGHNPGLSTQVTPDILKAAFHQPSPGIRASGFSTLSLPGLLSNIANKFLLNGWEGGDMTWSRISKIASARDFKERTSYRLNGFMDYEKVGPSGEIKHGTVGEETYTNQVDTYARMLAVTRRDFINDDLGALTDVPRELGYAAIDKLNNIYWTKFLANKDTAGNDFFTGTNNNVSTGVFNLAGITAAEAVLLKQTKPNGEPLSLRAEILLVPSELKRGAMQAVGSTLVVTGMNTTLGNANVWDGELRVESTPYLSNATYSGYSAVKYYLFANPNRMAVMEVAFLNGRQTPVIDSADADFNTLGVQMRGYHDFGVEFQEPRGGVQSSGAT